MCAVYAFCRADDIADGDWSDRFPGSLGEMDPEAKATVKRLSSTSMLRRSSMRIPT